MKKPNGPNVFLVGAGPGDPGLITRRGLELLQTCTVVLYDRLVDPRLLDEVPADAERIFVGKQSGRQSMPQAAIDKLVVEHARSGARVVRLKGGDPFVFGRGADEAQALAAAGIAFEIVPGVTSAIAVPAFAGIPLTHSGVSSSFAVLTAHASADRPGSSERWEQLARGAETLVLMMGVTSLTETVERLIAAGRDPSEPAAVIERGTTPNQRTVVAPLNSIAESARAAGIEPPAVTVVGPVVGLRDAVAWFESRPLFGRRVVVTRPAEQARGLADRLAGAGADVLLAPTIRIEDPPSWDELDRALGDLGTGTFEWVIFSSSNAVERFMGRAETLGLDARLFSSARIAAVGALTAVTLERFGLRADLVPTVYRGEELVQELGPGSGAVLLPRPAEAPDTVPSALAKAGWDVTQVETYRTVTEAQEINPEVADGRFDVLTFASGSAARGFVETYGKPDAFELDREGGERLVACIGPSTADVATELGFAVTVVADDHSAEGLVAALSADFS